MWGWKLLAREAGEGGKAFGGAKWGACGGASGGEECKECGGVVGRVV